MKTLVAIFAGIVLALSVGSAANAYPPGDVDLAVSTTTLSPGESFTATLTGCSAGEAVTFEVAGSTDEATCDQSGNATETLIAPMSPGTYVVVAQGTTSGESASVEITVVGDDGEPPVASPSDEGSASGVLPATGSSSTGSAVQLAGTCLFAGLGMVAVAYRRRIAPR